MKSKSVLLLTFLTFLAVAPASRASIQVSWQFGDFKASGGGNIPLNSLGVIVASTTDTIFGGAGGSTNIQGSTLTIGNSLGQADNQIIDIFSATGTGSGNGFLPGAKNYTLAGNWNAGDLLAIYWFPTISAAGTTLSGGESFGFFTSAVANTASGGTQGLVTPADTANVTIAYFTDPPATGSGITPAQFTANLVVAPEPSSFLLLASAGGYILLRRRRSS